MATTYEIDFTVTLSTCVCLGADSYDAARRLADELLDNDRFRDYLIERWDDPDSGWGDPNTPEILCSYEDGEPEFTAEDLKNRFGMED